MAPTVTSGGNRRPLRPMGPCTVPYRASGRKPVMAPHSHAQFRLRITKGDEIAVGPGKVALLEAIASNGSITAGAKRLGMSYRRAWLLVDTMNRCFKSAVVEAEAGGKRGGGASLTPLGLEVVQRYRRIEAAAAKAGAADLRAFVDLLKR